MTVFQSIPTTLNVIAGQTLSEEWDFFSDDALVTAFNLTGYTLRAVLTLPGFDDNATPVILTNGSGLTVNASSGIVQLQQDTTGWQAGRGHWYLQATDPTGAVSFPLRGALNVGNP